MLTSSFICLWFQDPNLVNYDPFKYTMVNLTTFQMYDSLRANSYTGSLNLQHAISHDALLLLTMSAHSYVDSIEVAECPPFCTLEHVIPGKDLMQNLRRVSCLILIWEIHMANWAPQKTGEVRQDGKMSGRQSIYGPCTLQFVLLGGMVMEFLQTRWKSFLLLSLTNVPNNIWSCCKA